MGNSNGDFLNPKNLVLPLITTAIRDTLVADVGTLIYNSSTNKLNICKAKAAGSGNWEAVTSA